MKWATNGPGQKIKERVSSVWVLQEGVWRTGKPRGRRGIGLKHTFGDPGYKERVKVRKIGGVDHAMSRVQTLFLFFNLHLGIQASCLSFGLSTCTKLCSLGGCAIWILQPGAHLLTSDQHVQSTRACLGPHSTGRHRFYLCQFAGRMPIE